MLKNLKRLAVAGMFLLPLGALHAQGGTITTSPTAEGTQIKNVASATYTDVNNNAYTAVKDSISITVGFLPAPNPTGQLTYSPASPSVGDTASFTITNSGNGIDSASVSVVLGTGLSFSKFVYNGVVYADAASLNAVISKIQLAAGASLPLPLKVVYDVLGNAGGAAPTIVLTQASVRTPAKTATWTTTINPPVFDSVTVSPDNATIAKVVSNGAADYTYTFTVTNKGNHNATFALGASVAGPANGTVTITNVSPASSGSLIPGATATITVSYKVLAGTAPDKIVASASGPASDVGDVTVSVSKASLSVAKTAWTSMSGGTLIANNAANAIVPGTTYYYKLAVTNAAGSADASKIVLTDVLSSSLTYVSSAGDVPADWAISTSTVAGVTTVTATFDPAKVVTAGATRFIWIGAKITTLP